MKKSFLKTICWLLLALPPMTTDAQRIATWQGGAAGKPNDWNCSRNWREGRVPNEMSDVVVGDVSSASRCLPIVCSPVTAVNSLQILSGGRLEIESKGQLEVLLFAEIMDENLLQNRGELLLPADAETRGACKKTTPPAVALQPQYPNAPF